MIVGISESPFIQDASIGKDQTNADANGTAMVTPLDHLSENVPPMPLKAVNESKPQEIKSSNGARGISATSLSQNYSSMHEHMREALTNNDFSPFKSGDHMNAFDGEQYPSLAEGVEEEEVMQSSTKEEDKTVKRLNFSPMREDEISSFYISPVTLTNDNSIRELSNMSLPPAMSISSNPFASIPLLSYTGPSQPAAAETVAAEDTAMAIDETQVEAKTEAKDEAKVESDKALGSRKRKPTDFFDVTAPDPNKKPRAPRKPRTTATTAKAASANPNKLSVEEEIALALAEDDEERALLESPDVEYDPKEEKNNKKKKATAASTGPKKPRTKKAATAAASVAVSEANTAAPAAPKPKVKTLASAFAKATGATSASIAIASAVVEQSALPAASTSTAMEVVEQGAAPEIQDLTQEEAEAPQQPVELSPETLAKINKYSERASSLAQEVASLEHNETLLDLKQLIPDELDRFLHKPVGIEFVVSEIIDPVTSAMNKAKAAVLLAAKEAKEAKEKADDVKDGVKEGSEEVPPSATVETQAVSETVSEPVSSVSGAVLEGSALSTACAGYIRSIMSRVIQGQTGSLSEVTEVVIGYLSQVVVYLQPVSDTTTAHEENNGRGKVAKVLLEELQSLGDHTTLQTEIKLLAERVVYTSTFATPNSLFPATLMQGAKSMFGRWEVMVLTSTFSENSMKLIKESRLIYNRYLKVIKSVETILSLLQGSGSTSRKGITNMEEKLAVAEDKFVKSFAEIEKMKEKKRELDLKKQQEVLEKLKKEEAKEAKKREKLSLDQAKAAEKAEKERKKNEEELKKTEEQRLKQMKLQKQQSFFKAFLGKPVDPPATQVLATPLVAISSPPAAPIEEAAIVSASSSAAAPVMPVTTMVSSKSKREQIREEQARQLQIIQDQRYEAFTQAVSQNLSMHEIMALQRVRYAENHKLKKSKAVRRRPKHVSVAVTVSSATSPSNTQSYPSNLGAGYALFAEDRMAASGGATTSNCEEVLEFRTFRNKLCVFSFHEDHRPAYVGTVSKRSTVINGRRPLKMDTHLLRYDYDSEEEWEEEDEEGEDIALSVGGSCDSEDQLLAKDAKDELQYDDFFRRDNDFGSDVDSDIDANDLLYNSSKVQREEVYGPRCVFSVCWQGLATSSPSSTTASTCSNSGQVLYALEKGKPSAVYTWSNPSQDAEEEKESDGMFVKGRTDDPEAIKLMSYAATLFGPPSALRLLHCSSSSSGPVAAAVAAAAGSGSAKKKGRPTAKGAMTAETVHAGAEDVTVAATLAGPPMIKGFDESKLPALITLLQGSKEGIDKLILTFTSTYAPHVTKAAVKRRILEIAEKKRHSDGHGSLRWIVKSDVVQGMEIAEVPFTPAKPVKAKTAKVKSAKAVTAVDEDGGGGPTTAEAASMKGFVNAAAAASPSSSKVIDL